MANSQTEEPTKAQLQIEFAALANMPQTASTRTEKFVEGLVLPYFGLRFVLARKEYVRLIMWPVILQTIVSLSMLGSFVAVGWVLKTWLQQAMVSVITWLRPSLDAGAISEWSGVLVLAVCGLAGWYLFLVVWRISGGLLDDYFGDKATNRVMDDLGLLQVDQSPSAPGTIFSGYRDAMLVHAGIAVCTPLTVIPVVGVFAAAFGGALIGGFIHGTSQLVTPLQGMGQSRNDALRTCFRHRWRVIGMACSRDMIGPIPMLGGLFSAGESVGRILLATRLMKLEESSESDNVAVES